MITGATVVAAFGDDQTAVPMHDIVIVSVPSTFTAAYVKVTDGKIAELWTVFDQIPFAAPPGRGLRRSDAGGTAMTCPPGRLALLHPRSSSFPL
jgi:hypothetical protein